MASPLRLGVTLPFSLRGEELTVGRGVVGGAVAGATMKRTWTTCFWVGEPTDKENAYIPNDCSYWDDEWMKHFGGVDDPDPRNGYHPAKFTPKQNPFYFALPYGERDDNDRLWSLGMATA